MSTLFEIVAIFRWTFVDEHGIVCGTKQKGVATMQKYESIVERLGLNQVSDDTAKSLLDALKKVEAEQGYLNESVTTLVSYLHMREQEAKKPIVRFKSRGESGNIYFLMQLVSDALRDKVEMEKLWERVKQGDYDAAIAKIREKVRLIDLDGLY